MIPPAKRHPYLPTPPRTRTIVPRGTMKSASREKDMQTLSSNQKTQHEFRAQDVLVAPFPRVENIHN